MQIIPARSVKKTPNIHTFEKILVSARINLAKAHNFFPNAREILNLEKNSTAMHHGIVAIPPLLLAREAYMYYVIPIHAI